MEKKDRIPIFISCLALIVSIISLLLTSPLVLDYYLKPKLSTTAYSPQLDGDKVMSYFRIDNIGRSESKNIIIEFWCFKNDNIEMQGVFPLIKKIKHTEKFTIESIDFEKRFYDIQAMPKNENILIGIASDKTTFEKYYKIYNNGKFKNIIIPNLAGVIQEGNGEVTINRIRIKPEIKNGKLIL